MIRSPHLENTSNRSLLPRRKPGDSLRDVILSRVSKSSSGCWEWIGEIGSYGYGVIWANRKLRRAHRVSYTIFIGPIPEGILVLHKCDNRKCVNPDHLFLGTQRDNIRDMDNKGRRGVRQKPLKTHCIHGHLFSDENTNFYHSKEGLVRKCRVCHKMRARAQRQRKASYP